MHMKRRHAFVVLAMAMAAALLPSNVGASSSVSTVTTGLDSPRGIAFFNGKLVVGEAGHGGSDCFTPPQAPADVKLCVGNSGQISWVNRANGSHKPLVKGLFSVTTPEGEALGVSGLSVGESGLLAQIGFTPREAPLNAFAQKQAGRLISVRSNGKWKSVASVGAFGFDYTVKLNSPTQELDSNPYGVLAAGDGAYVADAGSNILDWVNEDGKIKVLVHDPFLTNPPTFPHDSVPTCVVRDEDGNLLVGELAGRLIKVQGTTFTPVDVKDSAGNSLLSHVTGCTSDRDGNIYLVNMFGFGAPFTPPPDSNFFIGNVVQYNPESGKASVLANNLRLPNMDTVGPDGNLYVTVGAVCGPTPGPAGSPCDGLTGSVIKITLPHDEDDD
jgi:hypothetical protein